MDKKNMKVAVYFRTATVPIEQKVWLYASSKSSEQAEWRDLSVEAMKHTALQNGLVVAGVSTDSSRQLPPMERPGVQEMLAAVREGQVGAVMMPSLRHLGRELDAILPVLAEFQKQKVHIHAKDASALSPSAVSQTALKAERGRCTVSFPYADRPMWLYSRSSDKHLKVLFQQMQNLLDEANRREYTVAGTSQDMGSGKSMARMGLKQMMRAVKDGLAQAVLVQNLTRLSHDPAILMKILEFLQDHNTVLITTESDLRYELYIKGLEKHFLRRAAQKGLRLPW